MPVSIYGQLPYTFGWHGSIFNFFVFNSRSGSLIQFITKGYEQVAMIKMLFPTVHSILAQQSCCIISIVQIMASVSTREY